MKLKYNINNINDNYKFKTGDIILFQNNNNDIYNYLSYFTHAGIVIELNNVYYILEINPIIKDYIFQNSTIYNLYDRINNYDGIIFYLELNDKLDDIHINKFKENINKYLSIEFPYNYMMHVIQHTFNYFFKSSNDFTYLTCGEYIIYILNDIGLIKEICYTKKPDDLLNLSQYTYKGRIVLKSN